MPERLTLVRPNWLKSHIPALDGLRGMAILLVLLFHCRPRLVSLHLAGIAAWGWTGVNLFFVLSGFLITGIILDGRPRPAFFKNFYARRGLRILPVYALVVPVNYFIYGRANTWSEPGTFWPYFVFFAQNLVHGLTGTIDPTWSLAIEEQFYLVWAPIARRLPTVGLGAALAAILLIEPWLRRNLHGLTATHTLYHLDGLAAGALIALAVRVLDWPRQRWLLLARGLVVAGLAGWYFAWRGHGSYLDTFFAVGFAGCVLMAAVGVRLCDTAPLRYLGLISYGLYLTHMLVFAILGGFDAHMNRMHPGPAGDAAIVALRWAVSIGVASMLWYGFETPILSLKRYFAQPSAPAVRRATS
ncbi:MAG TPA: acyltransferase [Terriglobales bacterium]|nr:acyltransferase [Terriglobales bacterium]